MLTLLSITPTVDEMFGTEQADPAAANEITDEELARDAYDEARGKIKRYLQHASHVAEPASPFEVAPSSPRATPADRS